VTRTHSESGFSLIELIVAMGVLLAVSSIVTTATSQRLIKPQALLPFRIARDHATELFRTWIRKLWFAPDALKKMIEQVAFAAAMDESRPILTGVLAKFSGDKLVFAAADGFRLSVRAAPLLTPLSKPIEVIIPARALAELGRVSGEQKDPISILFPPQRSQVLFHLSNVELVSQLIDGKFPDYSAIVPKRYETRAVMDTAPLLKACRAASVFARENSNIARVTIAPGSELAPGHVTVQATSAETGDNAGELDASVEGAQVEIAFNVKFMIEVLSVAGTSQIALETTSPSSPGMIRPIGDDAFTHVIMPMHIGGR